MARSPAEAGIATVTGVARVDRRTKDLVLRIAPGEIAVIDHEDLDRVAAETLVEAQVGAVVNAAASISGRYPNLGPLLVAAAGIPLLDAVGVDVMTAVADGQLAVVEGGELKVAGRAVATGRRQTLASLEDVLEASRRSMGGELERFAENTLSYIQREGHLLLDEPDLPEVPVTFKGRHVMIVVRGIEYKNDLATLRRSGYLQEMKPLLVGVDGGADALLEIGCKPDLIIGDMDSVTERALRCGAALVVHGYADGRAPGAKRLDALGLDHVVFRSAGTSEDIAMLLAYERGAELIVALGTHSSMVEFLDKGRAGMASTFLVRMKVGPILVDAKGVSRLYENRVRKRDLLVMGLAAIFTLVVITAVSAPIRLVLRGLLLSFR
ncbi:MAG: thiamine pyrophosphokinae catalytic region [Acidimicrobiales bacterium]|nr:thiamine pyrophosphokinae catalytic region [Acidimicrobiales bacterium]